MPKLSKAAIKTMVGEYASLNQKRLKAEAAYAAELEPFSKKFELGTRSIRAAHEPKIQKLIDQQEQIQKDVIAWLNEQEKDVVVDGGAAEAIRKTETKVGARVINVKRFMEAAKAKGDEMYECINVVINKAEKLLGKKTIDAISTKPESTSVTTQLKLK